MGASQKYQEGQSSRGCNGSRVLLVVSLLVVLVVSVASAAMVIHLLNEVRLLRQEVIDMKAETHRVRHREHILHKEVKDHGRQIKATHHWMRAQKAPSYTVEVGDGSNKTTYRKSGEQTVARVKRTAGANEVQLTSCLQGLPGRDGKDGRDGRDGPQGPPGYDGITGEELRDILQHFKSQTGTVKTTENNNGTGGSVYVRWGRTTCPSTAKLVYEGIAAGSHYSHSGGGANKLCLPQNPQWGTYEDGLKKSTVMAYIFGAEYQTYDTKIFSNANTKGSSLHDQDVPCVVCHAPRASLVMIPARKECPASWTMEYNGYLTAERFNHQRSSFDCMDGAPEVAPSGTSDDNGALFYIVEAQCGSLPCPNYVQGRELTCVVCTK